MQEIIVRIAKKKIPVTLIPEPRGRIALQFPFFKPLIDEIKSFEGAKWHGFDEKNPRKIWTIADSYRNEFTLEYLKGNNPYARWEKPRPSIQFTRPLMTHQREMVEHILTVRWGIWAVEMRCGKTLAAIEAMERSGFRDDQMIWAGPKSALAGVNLELKLWQSRSYPRMLTYEGLKDAVSRWHGPAPKLIVFDEISRVKNKTAQRSQAAQYLADNMRKEWGDNCIILGMSGTPAPKTPVDWWNICEIICPGFLKEGSPEKLRYRLAKIIQKEGLAGGSYPELVTWYDSEEKCAICGQLKDHVEHSEVAKISPHSFRPGINEVGKLYTRMKGLVEVRFKKDILDLPEKIFKTVQCKPSKDVLNAWEIIKAKSARTITALILSRELSDGFQYKEVECGESNCLLCNGKGTVDPALLPPLEPTEQNIEDYIHMNVDFDFDDTTSCPNCKGTGKQKKYKRETFEVESPKIEVCRDLLDEHEEVGRIAFYAGFQGSLERINKLCIKEGWTTIQADGSGWRSSNPTYQKAEDMLFAFGNKQVTEKLAFIGQPGAAGMGIDLSATPTVVFYSNDFNAESRLQAIERAHGPKMNRNLGCTIIDIINLPTDQYVIDNLEKKIRLQAISMGEFERTIKGYK